MATANLGDFFRRLTRGMAAETLADHSDQQLVESALAGVDEAPFEAIVHRHGPMVFRVCRRVLQHPQDTEDAFQATFLILAQKLRALRKHASLASWLHGVAHRVALKAKAQTAARRRREHQASLPDNLPPDDVTWGELRSALDCELGHLPDKWRLPLVLCYLEGRTQDEAASQLGWSKNTLRRRLQDARAALGGRLKRRGIVWSAALSAVLLSDCSVWAAPAPGLIALTVKAVAGVAAGKTVATAVSAKVATLTEEVLSAMMMNTLKSLMTVLFVVLGTIVFGGGLYLHQAEAQQATADKSPAAGRQGENKGEDQKKEPPKNLTNSLGMKFVWIPAGSFLMGSPKEEQDRGRDETQHKVTLTKGFYMGVYTVTQEQWQEVMGNNPSRFKGEKNLPVDFPSWDDCQDFIKKLREKDKKPYRLPTEAEWEYACRAGTTTPFHFGETISSDQANYAADLVYGKGKEGKVREKTTPVGSFPANAWGLHDMHGNVYQWCQDRYGDFPAKEVIDPQGSDTAKPTRVMRGGSFMSTPWQCRSADRRPYNPGTRCYEFGFRLCFTLETPPKQEKEAVTAWGKEIGGLQAGLAFHPGDKRAYRHGETVKLVVRVRNVSKEGMKFSYLTPYIETPLTVTDRQGKAVPQAKINDTLGARIPTQVALAPGEEIDIHELNRELKPASDSGNKAFSTLYGTGKVSIQCEQVFGDYGTPTFRPAPSLTKLATGTLEIDIKSP